MKRRKMLDNKNIKLFPHTHMYVIKHIQRNTQTHAHIHIHASTYAHKQAYINLQITKYTSPHRQTDRHTSSAQTCKLTDVCKYAHTQADRHTRRNPSVDR